MTIHVVRHGQTEANRDGRWLGHSDSPLTDRGAAQSYAFADALAGLLPDVAAVELQCSHLRRARRTAALIAERLSLELGRCRVSPLLAEHAFGQWEGLTEAEIEARIPGEQAAGILPIVISLLVMAGVAWRLEQRHRVLRSRRGGLAITMIERIAMSPELDQMGRTGKERRALTERGETLRKDAVARRSRTASLQAILQAGTAIAGLAVLWSASQTGVAPGTVAASLAVLALLVLPLQNLATAWDRYCAWRVARGRAQNLFNEEIVKRRTDSRKQAVEVQICGAIAGRPVEQTFTKGGISNLDDDHAVQIARHIAGLDRSASLTVTFDGADAQPKTAFIGDGYVGLQGSLRRSVTLLCRKRPTDQKIKETLDAYGLGYLLERDRGLDTRIAESGRNLNAEETLRLDLARAELGKVYLLVVASIRWHAVSDGDWLLELFRNRSGATVIVTSPATNLQKRVA